MDKQQIFNIFYEETISDSFQINLGTNIYDEFLEKVNRYGTILYLCPMQSPDASYFLDKGYQLDHKTIGSAQDLLRLSNDFMQAEKKYDGIWAREVLRLLDYDQLYRIISHYLSLLKNYGTVFCSFRYGQSNKRDQDGMTFLDMTEGKLKQLLVKLDYDIHFKHWLNRYETPNEIQNWFNVQITKLD